jgi:carbamoyltransferase
MPNKDIINVGISRVHNSAVTILKNGEIVFHLENERLSNIKYDGYCFQTMAKIPEYVNHIDHLCIAGVRKTVPVEWYTDHDVFTTFITHLNKTFYSTEVKTHDLSDHHHKLHAACAFYNSGFKEAVCIIKDGMGSDYPINDPKFIKGSYGRESASTFVAGYPATFDLVDKSVIVPFDCDLIVDKFVKVNNSPSEGHAFQLASKYFGFHDLDAGKVMGMSSYGRPDDRIPPFFVDNKTNPDLFEVVVDGVANMRLKSDMFPTLTEDFQSRADFAFALQQQTQQEVKRYILEMIKKTKCNNVVLSGGYFLNCVANYELLRDLPDDIKVYIEPISSDAGTSIGAAKYVWHATTNDMTIRPQTDIYYGLAHNYTQQHIVNRLEKETYKKVTPGDIAQLIADKNIVALYQGRSESGPRALGNRSILYDPRDPAGKDHVNTVKNREWFRPFAGTILHEKANEWFDMRGLEESPYMMYAVDVLKDKQNIIPAITHVDGTCRIQTLKQEINPNYYKLIEEFNRITGVPILFNTSFNLAGDCICETIDDALRTIRNSSINYLYLPEFDLLILKN